MREDDLTPLALESAPDVGLERLGCVLVPYLMNDEHALLLVFAVIAGGWGERKPLNHPRA